MTHDEPDAITVRQITPRETLPLRQSVLLWPGAPPSQVVLPEDDHGYHFGAFLQGQDECLAVVSLFIEEIPDDTEAKVAARFRKLATSSTHRTLGLGTKLLNYIASFARTELHATVLWCDARVSAMGWYENVTGRGMRFEKFGNEFMKGPIRHHRLRCFLD